MTPENKVISIEYELREKGKDEILDSNMGGAPLSFVSGKGQIIPGLEKELVKMNAGDSATITVSPSEAYGEYNPEAIQTLPKEQFVLMSVIISIYLVGFVGEPLFFARKPFLLFIFFSAFFIMQASKRIEKEDASV